MSNTPPELPWELRGPRPVAQATPTVRTEFITKTYLHLLGAILTFVALEALLFTSGLATSITEFVAGTSWLLVLGAFMIVATIASSFAFKATTRPVQYAALGAYVAAQALIFVPMLWLANASAPGVISSAAAVTLIGFAGLTAVVFITRKDFSFMRGAIMWIGFAALGLIVGSVLFNFQLGTWFSVAMVVFAGGTILYNTSKVMNDFPEDRYVAASLQLFASVALMFWYVLRLFMGSRR